MFATESFQHEHCISRRVKLLRAFRWCSVISNPLSISRELIATRYFTNIPALRPRIVHFVIKRVVRLNEKSRSYPSMCKIETEILIKRELAPTPDPVSGARRKTTLSRKLFKPESCSRRGSDHASPPIPLENAGATRCTRTPPPFLFPSSFCSFSRARPFPVFLSCVHAQRARVRACSEQCFAGATRLGPLRLSTAAYTRVCDGRRRRIRSRGDRENEERKGKKNGGERLPA